MPGPHRLAWQHDGRRVVRDTGEELHGREMGCTDGGLRPIRGGRVSASVESDSSWPKFCERAFGPSRA